jgi:hypothetical protein
MEAGNRTRRVWIAAAVLAVTATACGRSAAVQTTGALPLRRVVVYRNGVGYFERQGEVAEAEVRFQVQQREVGDFLATLSVMERGGSTVRAAAFPMPEERASDDAPPPEQRRTVRLALDGARHDLTVGYTVETPIWRPSYRLIFAGDTVQVQAWGIVQNLSGEDWRDVRLSLVAGSPVSFRSELAQAVVPRRPVVTDQGAVIDAVPGAETTLAESEAPAAEPAPSDDGDGLGMSGTGRGGGGTGEGTIGLGSLGTIGRGAGGGSGQGYGAGGGGFGGLRGRSASGPIARPGAPTVQGSLSPEVVRRVVQRNLGQVRYCHEQGLQSRPDAQGRVNVRFVIGTNGAVQASAVTASTHPLPSVGQCIANAVRRWQFPVPEGGGVVAVNYPFNLAVADGGGPARRTVRLGEMAVMGRQEAQDAPSAAPRSVSALAALAVQGGTTRYDLPNAVTIPDRSATMVMLASRDVPGARMYLFAPDPGVPSSSSHPFHVARFENRTGALLERGPVAIFESGAFLGQGMLDALPDAATTTIPFAVERALAVEHAEAQAVEGARLVSMRRDALTLERFNVTRTTWRVRNGMDRPARVLLRQPLEGARLFEPPAGTEESNGNALVPVEAPARGRIEQVVTTRAAFTVQTNLRDEQAADALAEYLRDGAPAAETAAALRSALDLRRQMIDAEAQRADLERRRDDLQRSAEETRENLTSIQRNAQAADLRARLTQRLGRVATELDQLTRRIVEIDTQLSERRVRLSEAVQGIDLDTARPAGAGAVTR